jgi:predicted PurR-regulated permease PerM
LVVVDEGNDLWAFVAEINMARANSITEQCRSNALVSAAVVVGALYVGRDILLPFAISVLLSFLLAPLVERLEKWKFGRIPSVLTIVIVAFFSFAALAFVLAHQVYDLAYRLPDYKENIVAKAQAFQGDGTGVFGRVTKSVEEMRAMLSEPPGEEPVGAPRSPENPAKTSDRDESPMRETKSPRLDEGEAPPKTPVPVEVVETLSAREIAQGVLGPLISPLASAAIVIVFLIFMLLKREDLRNRLIHLIGGEQLNLTTQALDDAAGRVSRYLLMQLIINSIYGLVICVGLVLIGLPNALLWGACTALLRFVPYVGPWIAALMPIAISLAVFDGWMQPALVLALFVVNELISNNFIEPWLYGSSTGISTIGILASAVFWTWIWGPLGLVMATPLTVCLTVVGRYVPQLAFLNTMLSDQETLPPQSRFYQRLLAMDPEEATEVAEDYLATSSLEELYDTVLLPALSLAELDRHHGDLDEEKQRFVLQTTREIVEDLAERLVKAESEGDGTATTQSFAADPVRERASVLCLPARDEADEIAGLMLVQLLEQRGVSARVVSTQSLSGEMIEQVAAESAAIVCVSALPPFAATHARYLCKRLRPKFPRLQLIVGLWQTGGIAKKTQNRLTAIGIDKLVTTLSEAAGDLERLSQNALVAQSSSAPVGAA